MHFGCRTRFYNFLPLKYLLISCHFMEPVSNLKIFKFRNRVYLFLIAIPLTFILFITTFFIYFLIRPNENSIYFYLAFIVFIIQVFVLISLLSKFRYIPNGRLSFNSLEIVYGNQKYKWKDIKTINFYYRGDLLWESKVPIFKLLKPYNRYNNLHWNMIKGMDEKMLDKIQVNEEDIYVKIRNVQEKEYFFMLNRIAKEKGVIVDDKVTDFSYSLFGFKMKNGS